MSEVRNLITPSDLVAAARAHLESAGKTPDEAGPLQLTTPVSLVIKEGHEVRTINAVVTALSGSTCHMICKNYIHPSASVLIQFTGLPDQPRVVAKLTHCEFFEAGKHKLDAEFAAAAPAAA